MIEAEKGDHVAFTDVKRRQFASRVPDTRGERGVVEVLVGEADCRFFRREGGMPFDRESEVHGPYPRSVTCSTTDMAVSPAAQPVNKP